MYNNREPRTCPIRWNRAVLVSETELLEHGPHTPLGVQDTFVAFLQVT